MTIPEYSQMGREIVESTTNGNQGYGYSTSPWRARVLNLEPSLQGWLTGSATTRQGALSVQRGLFINQSFDSTGHAESDEGNE